MVVPAVVYSLLQWGQPGQNGWAIPMATDIAFVVGILTLFGDRIPIGFKVFLLSLAIVDDLASIVVIATLFSQSLSVLWLAIACVVGVSIYGLNVLGVRSVGVYTVAGFILWLSVFNSGVHPTVAGVALGLLTPTYAWVDNFRLMQIIDSICARENSSRSPELDPEKMHELSETALESISPLERLETALHPRVAFAIMPLFAFSNAGVALDVESISHPVAIAVALGLFVGKPLGILIFSVAAVRMGLTSFQPELLGGCSPPAAAWQALASRCRSSLIRYLLRTTTRCSMQARSVSSWAQLSAAWWAS